MIERQGSLGTAHAKRLPLGAAFVCAACSLVLVFATAGTPIPLYNTYRAQDAITNADLGIVSVGYFVIYGVRDE